MRSPCPQWSFNLAIEMLVISGVSPAIRRPRYTCFNLAIEMLVISGSTRSSDNGDPTQRVSISQSRCLSFQEICSVFRSLVAHFSFQSRNRDACHFRVVSTDVAAAVAGFNLAIEMLVISGAMPLSRSTAATGGFNLAIEMLVISGEGASQAIPRSVCFNLAIEMLVISGQVGRARSSPPPCFNLAIEMLVISGFVVGQASTIVLQACFNLAIEMLVISGSVRVDTTRTSLSVSISQSRCLSFQANHPSPTATFATCFNLAIEMLVISGIKREEDKKARAAFQSRNRDACHFRRNQ